jgi:hypothetical protein
MPIVPVLWRGRVSEGGAAEWEGCDELEVVMEKVRALVMRKEVVGLLAVASERRKIERVIDAIVNC